MLVLATVEQPGENLDLFHNNTERKLLDTTPKSPSKLLHHRTFTITIVIIGIMQTFQGERSKVKGQASLGG